MKRPSIKLRRGVKKEVAAKPPKTAASSAKIGLPPGSLIHLGPARHLPIELSAIAYNQHSASQERIAEVANCTTNLGDNNNHWILVEGLHDASTIAAIGERFGIHSLWLEDVMNTHQRPKSELMNDQLFLTIKMLRLNNGAVEHEQVSLVLTNNLLVSFVEHQNGLFQHLQERILTSGGRVRQKPISYLFYLLIDTVVDHYFTVTEWLSDAIADLENAVVSDRTTDTAIKTMLTYRRELAQVRRQIVPLREALQKMEKLETSLIPDDTAHYLNDVFDHAMQIADSLEAHREMLNSLLEIHLSRSSIKMNQIMKVLTIISTIFIPLTFLAGLYGMNFKHMPELDWPWGYPALLGFMLLTVLGMLLYFRRKNWL